MTRTLTIGEYMVPHPYTVQYFEPLGVAEKIMNEHRIRHLPVVDGSRIYGIISDGDIKLAAGVYKDKDYHLKVHVKDICLSEPYVVEESEPLLSVVTAMSKRRLESAIITQGKRVVGIFTITDACRLLAELIRERSGR